MLLISVLIGLSLQPGIFAERTVASERGTPPRHVEHFRLLAETIVRVATKATRSDRYVPSAGVISFGVCADRAGVGADHVCAIPQVLGHDRFVREALLNLPPPAVA